MSQLSMFCMGRWDIVTCVPTLPVSHLSVLFYTTMGTKINNFGTINYHDHHKEITINGAQTNVSDIVRSFMAEDVESVEEVKPDKSFFKFLTKKCIDEKRVEAVEAEIKAAIKGTAETLWRTIWNNENLGYLETQNIDATTLYHEIENHYGKLPYKVRNFREARNKR